MPQPNAYTIPGCQLVPSEVHLEEVQEVPARMDHLFVKGRGEAVRGSKERTARDGLGREKEGEET